MHRVILLLCVFLISSNGLQLLPTSSKAVTATVSSFYEPASSPEKLITGTGSWNSGQWGIAWIQFDLGTSFKLTNLTLTCQQTVATWTGHTILGGNLPNKLNAIASFYEPTANGQKLKATFTNVEVRYIKVLTTQTTNWVAWSGITLHGERTGNEVQLVPTTSPFVSARASGTADSIQTPDALITGTGIWNSGKSGENWIQIDLGKPFLLSSISLTCAQTVTAHTTHVVTGSKYGEAPAVLAVFDGTTSDQDVLSADFEFVEAQYVKILTNRSSDWVAWRGLTILGEKLGTYAKRTTPAL